MKTKSTLLTAFMAAIIWLFTSGPVSSQELLRNPSVTNLGGSTTKFERNAAGHFAYFPNQNNDRNPLSLKSTKTVNYLADTVYRYSINSGNGKTVYTYDNNANLLTTLDQIWIINKWVNKQKITNVYDANGNLLTQTMQQWQNTVWVDQKKIMNTYDGAGNCLTTTGQDWDGTAWVNWGQSEYSYDGNGNMLTELFSQWDGSAWMYNTLDSCTWDANGNCLAMMNLMWDGMAWMSNMLESWTYDANGKMLSDIAQFWDGMGWSYMYQVIYTNNVNGYRTSSLEQYHDGMGWVNSYRDTMMYDAANNYISYTNWNSWDGMTWELYSKGDFTYDSNGNLLTRINQMWNTVTWKNYVMVEYSYQSGLIVADAYTWTGTIWTADDSYFNVTYNDNGNKIVFYNGSDAAVEVTVNYSVVISGMNDPETNGSNLVAVYPNPVTGFLTILPANPGVIIKNVQIFDFSGKELVADFSGNRLNLGNLQNGMYILKLTMLNGFTEVKKIVKQ